MKAVTPSLVCFCLLTTVSFAHAETRSPVFGSANIKPTTAAQNKSITGKGYYQDYYGYYGNYYNYYAGYYGNLGYSYGNASYYSSAYQYATYAANYYYYASIN